MSDINKGDTAVLSPDTTQQLVLRARDLFNRLQPAPPLAIEMAGTPASGKTSAQQNLRHLFRRTKYRVTAPREGAEAIEGPRPLPDYNVMTFMYAMLEAFSRCQGRNFDIALFDRALWDGVVRMELYRDEGVISAEEHSDIERFMLRQQFARLFHLHIFLVCSPETTLARKSQDELISIPGKTLNEASLRRLYDAHRNVWDRLKLGDDPRFLWVDTDDLDKRQVVAIIAAAALDALDRKLKSESR
jgi:hypothetical protein